MIACVDRGWPRDRSLVPSELLTFYEKRDSVSYEDGILMWQGRIIVPEKFRLTIVETLHDGHPGIWAMRALAHFYVWWPNIDRDVEQHVRGCDPCQQNCPREPETLLYSWNAPSVPWARIHVDYAGPFDGRYWLVVIDSHSKWLEIKQHQTTTTKPLKKAT